MFLNIVLAIIALIAFIVVCYFIIKMPYQDDYNEYVKNKEDYKRFLKSRSEKYF